MAVTRANIPRVEIVYSDGQKLIIKGCKLISVQNTQQPIELFPDSSDLGVYRKYYSPDIEEVEVQMEFTYSPSNYRMMRRMPIGGIYAIHYRHNDKQWEQAIRVTSLGPHHLDFRPIGEPKEVEK